MKQIVQALAVAAVALSISSGAYADACRPNCGKVSAVNAEKREGKGSGLGAVAGGVAGGLLGNQIGKGTGNTIATIGGIAGGAYVGHEVEKKAKSQTVFAVHVQMDDGNHRQFDYGSQPAFAPGDRVQIVNKQLRRYTGP